jgi:menaquinone-dependent protoporphyrinogen oxidase
MRVLVTWGSTRGGTEGIARTIGEALQGEGFEVDMLPPRAATKAAGFDAAIVGGALYANRWHHAACSFVRRRRRDLQRVPVWFFSSGPRDDSSDRENIPPTLHVQTLMERVGALGHATFGGRLTSDARGFPASVMAKKRSGDWRNLPRIRAWASEIAHRLPTARPGPIVEHPGGSIVRLVAHGMVGWAACAAVMAVLLHVSSVDMALAIHLIAAPVIFALVAQHYFRARGARDSMTSAVAFVATVALLDLIVVSGLVQHSVAMFRSAIGTWVPFALIGVVTWATGEWRWMASRPRGREPVRHLHTRPL